MPEKSSSPNYYLEFLKSRAHACIAFSALCLCFASPNRLGIGVAMGVFAYVLAWICVPNLAAFRLRRNLEAAELGRYEQAVARATIEVQLIPAGRKRYALFSDICAEIQQALQVQEHERGGLSSEEVAPRMEEFRISFLKLLTSEQRLALILKRENPEELQKSQTDLRESITKLEAEIALRRESGNFNSLATEERLLESRREHILVLDARLERQRDAIAKLSLVQSELNRVMDRVKLIRVDALAQTLESNAVTSPLEETMEQLLQTNRWLADTSPLSAPPPQREFGSLQRERE